MTYAADHSSSEEKRAERLKEALAKEIDRAGKAQIDRGIYLATANALAVRVARAEAALEPFARAADDWFEMGDTRPIDEDASITVADLRRAAACLAMRSNEEDARNSRGLDATTVIACIEAVRHSAWKHAGSDEYSQGMDKGARHQVDACVMALHSLLPLQEPPPALDRETDLASVMSSRENELGTLGLGACRPSTWRSKLGRAKTENPTMALANINAALWREAEKECSQLKNALRDLLAAHDPEHGVIDVEPDEGCQECTSGATPSKHDTGPCAYHRALALVDVRPAPVSGEGE